MRGRLGLTLSLKGVKAQPWLVCRRRGQKKSGLWLLGGSEGAALVWWDGVFSSLVEGDKRCVCVPASRTAPLGAAQVLGR